MTQDELDFLRESNNIEGEWDDTSLADAVLAWQYINQFDRLTVLRLLQVHKLLMQSRTTLDKKDVGKFREQQVWIGGREGKPWYAVRALIEEWVKAVNTTLIVQDQDKEQQAKELHIRYEDIHPFVDGNGRTGRVFYNWQRVKMGLPVHVIHTGVEQFAYYKWFK